jgi:hypothetical protein
MVPLAVHWTRAHHRMKRLARVNRHAIGRRALKVAQGAVGAVGGFAPVGVGQEDSGHFDVEERCRGAGLDDPRMTLAVDLRRRWKVD